MQAFVIRPFGEKTDRNGKTVIDFDRVHRDLITPALRRNGLNAETTGKIVEAGNIREDMFKQIVSHELVICDVTIHNANVFYELGIRHALKRGRTVLIKGTNVEDATPFDVLTDRYTPYSVDEPKAAVDDLAATVKATLDKLDPTDSPVFKLVDGLTELDTASIFSVPDDFMNDLIRAREAGLRGWLRQLRCDVAGKPFERGALRLIGRAMVELGDVDEAKSVWTQISTIYPDDCEANLAVANVHQQAFKGSDDVSAGVLMNSDNALERVFANPKASRAHVARAHALRGHGARLRWRASFADKEAETKRQAAANLLLWKAYKHYSEAYQIDLNNHRTGIVALQTGTMLRALSQEPRSQHLFVDQTDAFIAQRRLERDLPRIQAALRLAVSDAKTNGRSEQSRLWAALNEAQVAFLSDATDEEVMVPLIDIARLATADMKREVIEQFKEYSELGLRAELADKIIAGLGSPDEEREAALRVVIFVGHMIDRGDRKDALFPPECEAEAKRRIRQEIECLCEAGERVHVFASVAPGADILCHEVCQELALQHGRQIENTMCFPVMTEVYETFLYQGLSSWWRRLLKLKSGRSNKIYLAEEGGLPRWLASANGDTEDTVWDRGNNWVIEIATAMEASERNIVALWNPERKKSTIRRTIDRAESRGFTLDEIDIRELTKGCGTSSNQGASVSMSDPSAPRSGSSGKDDRRGVSDVRPGAKDMVVAAP